MNQRRETLPKASLSDRRREAARRRCTARDCSSKDCIETRHRNRALERHRGDQNAADVVSSTTTVSRPTATSANDVGRAFRPTAQRDSAARRPLEFAHSRPILDGARAGAVAQSARRNAYVTVRQWIEVLKRADASLTDLLVFLKETGCSMEEAIVLRGANVHRRICYLFCSGCVDARPRQMIVLTDRAREIAERLIQRFPTGPIFRGHFDAPWSPESLARRIGRLRLDFDFSLYSLPPTYVADAFHRGLDARAVARPVGWIDAAVTDSAES